MRPAMKLRKYIKEKNIVIPQNVQHVTHCNFTIAVCIIYLKNNYKTNDHPNDNSERENHKACTH